MTGMLVHSRSELLDREDVEKYLLSFSPACSHSQDFRALRFSSIHQTGVVAIVTLYQLGLIVKSLARRCGSR